MKKVTQIKISHKQTHSIVFTDLPEECCVGWKIRFRDQEKYWNIDEIYQSFDKEEINRTWKVGGL